MSNNTRKRSKRPRLEKKGENEIREYLRSLKGCWHVKTFGITGLPDIIGCYKGKFFGLEVKSETGKTSPLQKYTIMVIGKAGGIVGVVRTVADVKELL